MSLELPPNGTIYGALLNDRATLARLGTALHESPYMAPPQAPVLYIKTANTRAPDGAAVAVPAQPGIVQVNATVGALIGTRACRVARAKALGHVAGYVIASDLSLPIESYYRPAVRQRCRDAFCPLSAVVPPQPALSPDALEIVVHIDGREAHRRNTATLVRSLAQLIADMTEFMTLEPGDLLLLGPPDAAPTARAGQSVHIDVAGLGSLTHSLVNE
jgi:5-oxopent-3-ene-1,2,5-tricarboxylate decarboxylase/2-hydroxyhepta-2,4-diene-1,7-dioate isomerase